MKQNKFLKILREIRFPFISQFEKEDGFPFLHKKQWQYVALIILAFIWGSSFILMKRGLETFSAGQVAALRIFLSFLFFVPFIVRRLKKLTNKNLLPVIIVGVIGNGVPAILFTTGQTELSSSLTGILNSLTPLFTLIVGLIFFRLSTGWKNVLGIVLGLVGAAGLILNGENHFLSGNFSFSLLVIGATVCYAFSTNVIKEQLANLDGLSITALAFLMIGPPAGVYLFFTDIGVAFNHPDAWQNFYYIIYLAFFSSFLAVTLFTILIKYTSSIFASSVTYVIPVFAVMWGLLDGEAVTYLQFIWIFIILIGVYLVNMKIKKSKS